MYPRICSPQSIPSILNSGKWTVEHIDHGSHRVVKRKKSALISLPTSRFTTSTAPLSFFSFLFSLLWTCDCSERPTRKKERHHGRCFYVLLCLSHLSISSSPPSTPPPRFLVYPLYSLLPTLPFISDTRISHHFHDACLLFFFFAIIQDSSIFLCFFVCVCACVVYVCGHMYMLLTYGFVVLNNASNPLFAPSLYPSVVSFRSKIVPSLFPEEDRLDFREQGTFVLRKNI
ncbi:MAG: hypothetical protein BYD32DRAFT_175906 [Podila humilis]|nr:MAG: hypothetical protein BYD32DRAFT_175906 [Podila humilis]